MAATFITIYIGDKLTGKLKKKEKKKKEKEKKQDIRTN